MYYNDDNSITTAIIVDAGILTGQLHGLFSDRCQQHAGRPDHLMLPARVASIHNLTAIKRALNHGNVDMSYYNAGTDPTFINRTAWPPLCDGNSGGFERKPAADYHEQRVGYATLFLRL